MAELKITIPKRLTKGASLVSTPTWISDGHWMIRRELVQNEVLFCSEDVAQLALGARRLRNAEDKTAERVLLLGYPVRRLFRTRLAYVGSEGVGFALLFAENPGSPDRGASVFLSKAYADAFRLEGLLSPEGDSELAYRGGMDADGKLARVDLVVMGMRLEEPDRRRVFDLATEVPVTPVPPPSPGPETDPGVSVEDEPAAAVKG